MTFKAVVLAVSGLWGSAAFAQDVMDSAAITADDRLNALVWQMTSGEYEGAARTAYSSARTALDRALKNKKHTAAEEQQGNVSKLPPAIIMDIDETVLDNGPVQVHMLMDDKTRPGELMGKWFDRAAAKSTPGAAEFIQYAQSKGVTVFFISNRNADKEAPTRKNLETIGVKFPQNMDTVFLEREREDWKFDKGLRRSEVAKTHRILMLIGDDFGDFTSTWNKTAAERRAIAQTQADRWGKDWIMIPNPMYGSWENAAINFNFRASADERRKIKHDALKAFDSGE